MKAKAEDAPVSSNASGSGVSSVAASFTDFSMLNGVRFSHFWLILFMLIILVL